MSDEGYELIRPTNHAPMIEIHWVLGVTHLIVDGRDHGPLSEILDRLAALVDNTGGQP